MISFSIEAVTVATLSKAVFIEDSIESNFALKAADENHTGKNGRTLQLKLMALNATEFKIGYNGCEWEKKRKRERE